MRSSEDQRTPPVAAGAAANNRRLAALQGSGEFTHDRRQFPFQSTPLRLEQDTLFGGALRVTARDAGGEVRGGELSDHPFFGHRTALLNKRRLESRLQVGQRDFVSRHRPRLSSELEVSKLYCVEDNFVISAAPWRPIVRAWNSMRHDLSSAGGYHRLG